MPTVLVLPGDVQGPGVTDSASRVLKAVTDDGIDFEYGTIGISGYEATGSYLPVETLDMANDADAVLLGPVRTEAKGTRSDPIYLLKHQLDLSSSQRVFRTLADDLGVPGVDITLWSSSPLKDRDIIETPEVDGVSITKYVNKSNCRALMERALKDMERRGSTRVDCVTRTDIFPESSGVFGETLEEVFSGREIAAHHEELSRWLSWLVRRPTEYDTVICADLYGNPVAGLLAGLTGGNHLSPMCFDGGSIFLAESGHADYYLGIDPENINPTSMILGGALALLHMGMRDECTAIYDAVTKAYRRGLRTPDVGGTLTSTEFTDEVVALLNK